jgi:hypothetical protein
MGYILISFTAEVKETEGIDQTEKAIEQITGPTDPEDGMTGVWEM